MNKGWPSRTWTQLFSLTHTLTYSNEEKLMSANWQSQITLPRHTYTLCTAVSACQCCSRRMYLCWRSSCSGHRKHLAQSPWSQTVFIVSLQYRLVNVCVYMSVICVRALMRLAEWRKCSEEAAAAEMPHPSCLTLGTKHPFILRRPHLPVRSLTHTLTHTPSPIHHPCHCTAKMLQSISAHVTVTSRQHKTIICLLFCVRTTIPDCSDVWSINALH